MLCPESCRLSRQRDRKPGHLRAVATAQSLPLLPTTTGQDIAPLSTLAGRGQPVDSATAALMALLRWMTMSGAGGERYTNAKQC